MAAKEGRATLLSPRLVIVAILLSLVILAGTYSILPGPGVILGTPNKVAYGFTYWEELNRSRPAFALFAASPTGEPLSGVEVQVKRVPQNASQQYEILETHTTDVSGWVRFEGLWNRHPDSELLLGLADEPLRHHAFLVTSTDYAPQPVEYRGRLEAHLVALGGSPDRQVVSLVMIDALGEPVAEAEVFIIEVNTMQPPMPGWTPPGGWPRYHNGTTDANGYYLRSEPLEEGVYDIRVTTADLNASTLLDFGGGRPNPYEYGPDGVLAVSGLVFLPVVLPIMALAIAFDAIARERAQGSLDTLLSKPVSRAGVAIGKLMGVLAALAVPATVIILAAAALVWALTGMVPTGGFLASFLGTVLYLLLVYTLVFLVVSSSTKNMGTALLASVLLFLLYAFFWGLVSIIIANLMAPGGSVDWLRIVAMLSLATPTGVYQQLLTSLLPALVETFYGPIGGTGQELPPLWISIAALLWVAVPLAFFVLAMKYRVTEG